MGSDTRYDVNWGGPRLLSEGLGFYPEGEGDSIIKSVYTVDLVLT